jgi:hypothetical protein
MKLWAKLLIVAAIVVVVQIVLWAYGTRVKPIPAEPGAITADNYDKLIEQGMTPEEAEKYLMDRARKRLKVPAGQH